MSEVTLEGALAECFRRKEFDGFAAELELPGEHGSSRRLAVHGRGEGSAIGNGFREDAGAPRTIGIWRKELKLDAVKTIVGACAAATPDTRAEARPGVAALRVQAGRASAFASLPPDVARKLANVFEEVLAGPRTVAGVTLEMSLDTREAPWKGELRIAATGEDSFVLPDVGAAAAGGLLQLVRAEMASSLSVPKGEGYCVLSPGEVLTRPFVANPTPGQGGVRLRWTVRTISGQPAFGLLPAPTGVLLTLPSPRQ